MSTDFGKQNCLKQKTFGAGDNIPISALNYEQLSSIVNLSRDIVEKIITKYIYVLGRSIREGRKVSMLIHKIAAINIENGEFKCEFMTEFIDDFRSPAIGTSGGRGLGLNSNINIPMQPGRSMKGTDGRTTLRTTQSTQSSNRLNPNNTNNNNKTNDNTNHNNMERSNRSVSTNRGERTGAGLGNRPSSSESMRSDSSVGTTGSRSTIGINSYMSPRSNMKNQSTERGILKNNNNNLDRSQRQNTAGVASGNNFNETDMEKRKINRSGEGKF